METGKKDRISRYLIEYNKEMLFGELSEDFLRVMGAGGLLNGVPVPVNSGENGQIAVKSIVLDMARVIGADPDFIYADKYLAYIKAVAGDQAEPMLVAEGAKLADEGRYEESCMLLRTALAVQPKSRAALYLYGRACKACYEAVSEAEAQGISTGKGEEYIGAFKAEAMDIFEVLTMMHPEYAMGYYFLGYAYLNLGLYLKTKLTWDDFMKYSSNAEDDGSGLDYNQMEDLRHEISGMLLDLEEPVQIEKGCNQIMGGDFVGGRDTLGKFKEGRYENWWPLWYYLGVAESALGNLDEAIADLRRVLTLSPSNTDVMDELAQVYEAAGDIVNAAKYRNKIEVVKKNSELDRTLS
ncbi:MAG: tetratricopeptide repeat protein [Mogibacterium sp.]|nr:tetratricopeptide repeat protein [Mogibacterium sp.]